MNKSHTSWIAQVVSASHPLYYLRYQPQEGKPAYFFLLLDKAREHAFLAALKSELPFDLKEYGDIVKSGFGEEAPESAKAWIRAWYQASL